MRMKWEAAIRNQDDSGEITVQAKEVKMGVILFENSSGGNFSHWREPESY